MNSLNIGVVDDHWLFLKGFVLILSKLKTSYELNIILECTNEADALKKLNSETLDLIFLDLNLQQTDGIRLIPKLKELFPKIKIIIVSMSTDVKLVREAFQKGADGYLSKNSDYEDLSLAIEEVMEGKIFFGKGIESTYRTIADQNKLSSAPVAINRFTAKYHLTKRELEILEMISQGKSSKDIASELFISKETVNVHRKNVMRKLEANSALSLVKIARDFNLI
ncbi:MAG TPA: response regulator transcription factor [Saprospiraceae bacterium]|nr:response regulator transcription factor [Saprospiraceae bacterium]